ncbi:MAG: hypothetical protein LBD68_09195 [Zoogloeaceae bacterium]|jgi:predicted helicase|nr:hypothetical protein [Zoogloeaceae bacterium]
MMEPDAFHPGYLPNLVICVSGGTTKDFSVLMTDTLPDLHVTGGPSQCFPLYLYEEQKAREAER